MADATTGDADDEETKEAGTQSTTRPRELSDKALARIEAAKARFRAKQQGA